MASISQSFRISRYNTAVNSTPYSVVIHSRKRINQVYAFKKEERSGIHDPAGPVGSWATGEGKSQLEQKAQEQRFVMNEDALAKKKLKSMQHTHAAGKAVVNRTAAVNSELTEMADEKADEEYSHMSKTQKIFMEVKNALYSWLKTGVEPL